LVVASFDDFTENGMLRIVREINRKFSKELKFFDSPTDKRRVAFQTINHKHKQDPRMKGSWWTNPVPSEKKEGAKAHFQQMVLQAQEKGVFDQAWQWYEAFGRLAGDHAIFKKTTPEMR
jgi:hypothetical protein